MKLISLFLCIVVLTLTLVPCCALEENDGHAHQTVQKEQHECNEQDDDCCKDCSPFYVCGTCIGFTFASQATLTFALQVKPVQHNTVYIPIELSTVSTAIWQPPKIS